MTHTLISTTAQLEAFCEQLQGEQFITVDTEFIREKTYYPRLCLIQVAGTRDAFAIDPLSNGIDLAPLAKLLQAPNILKVFHAARQDLEIFYLLNHAVPFPVFDTQIAAQFCGYGESISYSDLVKRTVNVNIDKASRFTDWAKRPLTPRQMEYALSDVVHLRQAYLALVKRLEKKNRMEWVMEEMAQLADENAYRTDPDECWRKLKLGGLKPKHLAVLRAITAWREREAQRLDIPRARLVRDETLLEIAAMAPATVDDLRHVRGTSSLNPHASKTLLALIDEARHLPQDQWPRLPERTMYPAENNDAVALLQMLLALQCRRHDMLPRLVATRDELEAIAAGETDVPAMKDWRHEIFGEQAQKLMSGALKLYFDPRTKQVMLD